MATRTRSTSQTSRSSMTDETPIKHTAGGEMPDPTDQHHVDPEELEALGGVEGEETTSNFLNQSKAYLPLALGAIGLGLGIYFLATKYGQGELKDRLSGLIKNWRQGETDTSDASDAGAEGKQAMDVDDVAPTRLMGA